MLAMSRKEWWNDSCIVLRMKFVCEFNPDVIWIDSMVLENSNLPRVRQIIESRIRSQDGLVLFPVNVIGMHWCGFLLDFNQRKMARFDPLQMRTAYKKMTDVYMNVVQPLIHGRPMQIVEIGNVKQPNMNCCGLFTILLFHFYCNDGPWGQFNDSEIDF